MEYHRPDSRIYCPLITNRKATGEPGFFWLSLVFSLIMVIGFAQMARSANYTWLESEKPDSITPENIKPDISSDGRPDLLSGGNWLKFQVENDALKNLPDDGISITYKFNLAKNGNYQIWNRLGYETVRSAFQWKIDNGEWADVLPSTPSFDLQELYSWNPIAWVRMGVDPLNAGDHTLIIHLPKKDATGALSKIFYVSDAICIYDGTFHPNDSLRPDEAFQTDADKAAAAQVFQVPVPNNVGQEAVSLKGPWQLARYDEMVLDDPYGPTKEIPSADSLYWKSMNVPGDRNAAHPEWTYAHRFVLRTHVAIPAELAGHSFYLHFPSLSMLATVFVNGQQCGFTKNPLALWDCDITRAVKPGQINDIWVVIKDIYYSLPFSKNSEGQFISYLPLDKVAAYGPTAFNWPVWNHYETGILADPSLVVAGKAYVSDVFAIPSVKNKTLGLEITVHNPSDQDIAVSVENSVAPLDGGPVEKVFASKNLVVSAGKDAVLNLSEGWATPKLWWPDDPEQYNVITRLAVDGKGMDEVHTKFGFREWGWHGKHFTLNGVPWHGRGDVSIWSTDPAEDIRQLKAHGQDMVRFWGEDGWEGLPTDRALDLFDSMGMPVRRTGIFDGEMARYQLVEQVEQGGKKVMVPREELFHNWRDQLLAWARGERNHPSIFIWSMENEVTFINSKVFGNNALTDPEMRRAADELMAMDPTRPVMVDGGNALLDQSLPVYGCHYTEGTVEQYPDWAYTLAGIARPGQWAQPWPMTEMDIKPTFFGETFYANGYNRSTLAAVGGESAFLGKAESYPAIGLLGKMMSEGYRWYGLAAFQFWVGNESNLYYNSWQPRVALVRQWDSTFNSGQKVTRTIGVFNDTHDPSPITFVSTLEIGGKTRADQTRMQLDVPPGMNKKFNMELPMPVVNTRTSVEWYLGLVVNGKRVWTDVKDYSVLPSPTLASSGAESTRAFGAKLGARGLIVYDPNGSVTAFLRSDHIPFTLIPSLGQPPSWGKVLIVGKDALDDVQSTSSALAAYAAPGRTVIVLEQQFPLKFQALPGQMAPATNKGRIAFPENSDHPIFAGLKPSDFFTWAPGEVVYRDAYEKPTSGGRSLMECDEGLANSPLVEMPAGQGDLLISQLLIGEKIATNSTAQHLLLNMIDYAASYRLKVRPVFAAEDDAPAVKAAMDAIGLKYTPVTEVLKTIDTPGSIALINGTPDNLKLLADNLPKVHQFTRTGGWIMLTGVGPAGLAYYDKIVGVDHIMRKFTQEKVTFPAIRNPLTEGLSASNIAMSSGKRIFSWQTGDYPADDAFSYVVDLEDVAPFAKSDFYAYHNITNNFVSADGWPLIINFPAPTDGKPYDIHITLPRQETIKAFTWIGNDSYWPTDKVNLIFDGDRKNMISYDVQPNNEPQSFDINPPRPASEITLELAHWVKVEGKGANIGIDNIYLYAQRPADFYTKVRPMLNIGALVEYPMGQGGIVLNEVNYKDTEAVPENMTKKRTIMATILHNLMASFSGGKTIIAGSNLEYQPLDISKQVNQFRNEQGWFGDRVFTFKDLPTGRHIFAGVPYNIYEFATSPTPNCIMLGGQGIPNKLADNVTGIPVNQKADALFFLQAARIDHPMNADDIKNHRQFEMARYVVHYADGQIANIPIYSQIDVDNYKQKLPVTTIAGAQVAWVAPYAGTDQAAVAYSQQWNNPRPGVVISSIDMVYGKDRRGVPALLAVTAAVGR